MGMGRRAESFLKGRQQAPPLGLGKGTGHFGNHCLKAVQGAAAMGINQEPITKTALHLEYKKEQ